VKCPVCNNTDLLMTERQGVEIDYCPDCRGVWLDRGELDRIVERSSGASASPAGSQAAQRGESRDHYDKHHDSDHGDRDHGGYDAPGGRRRPRDRCGRRRPLSFTASGIKA
jgi:Zn-finger nucleic acid-binding protein